MRLLAPPIALATVLVLPTVAEASPFAIPLSAADLARIEEPAPTTDSPAMDAPAVDADAEPMPADPDLPMDPDASSDTDEPAETVEGPGEDPDTFDPTTDDPTLAPSDDAETGDETEPTPKGKANGYNANAIGINGGIQVIPSWILKPRLAGYGNAMCRKEVGSWGEDNGLVKVGGCNFYFNGGYTRRITRAFDISTNVGYLHIKPEDSLWLGKDEWDRDSCETDLGPGSACNLGGADYTKIDLRMFTVEVNFIGRGTLFRNEDVEIQLGGGGGIGIGVLVGEGIARTPLGRNPGSPDDPSSCQTLDDLGDFRKCTPRYYDDIDIDQNGDGDNTDVSREQVDMGMDAPAGILSTGTSFASCSSTKCDGSDLSAFGSTETGGTWPVYPLINIMGSFRMIIKDTFGLTIDGGIKDGFFFGAGMQYYFGGGGKEK